MTVVFGCLIWFPLMIWTVSLVHWMVQGDIDPIHGVLGIGCGIGLGFIAFKPPVPVLSPVAFFLVACTIAFFPFLRMSLDRRQLRSIDVEAVEKAYDAIGQRPDNLFARFKLASAIYQLGMIGHAVAMADYAMAQVPERLALEEHRLLKRWKAAGVPPETLKPIECVECRHPCQPGWTHCRNCGAPFLLHRIRGKVFPEGHAKQLMGAWIAIVLSAVAISVATALPPIAALLVIPLILVAAILFVVAAARAIREPAA